jgi:hypothetical protein
MEPGVACGSQGRLVLNIFCVRPRRFNVGNEAIFVGTRQLLLDAFDGQVNLIGVPARASGEPGEIAGLTKRTIHEMNQYGHGIVIGGGNLYENAEIDLDVHALGRLQPPLMLFSLSRGRIYDRAGRLVDRTDVMPDGTIRALHDAAVYSLSRDGATVAHVRGLGMHTELGGCPTLLLGRMDLPLPAVAPALRDSALVAIRHPHLMNVPLKHQARVQSAVVGIIDVLRTRGLPVRLVCNDQRDLAFGSSLGDVELLYPGDALTHLALLRTAAVVVTFRLHSFLPCLSFGTPAVNISYDERSSSMVETAGIQPWDIDLIHTTDVVDAVSDRVNRLGDLERLRDAAVPRWDRFEATLREGCRRFAAAAAEHAAAGS